MVEFKKYFKVTFTKIFLLVLTFFLAHFISPGKRERVKHSVYNTLRHATVRLSTGISRSAYAYSLIVFTYRNEKAPPN